MLVRRGRQPQDKGHLNNPKMKWILLEAGGFEWRPLHSPSSHKARDCSKCTQRWVTETSGSTWSQVEGENHKCLYWSALAWNGS